MLLSIVVPIYNVQEFLEKCIGSILIQKFKDYELILVDDGSTDKSGSICDEYSKKDNRIKVIHKKNGGLSSARNSGIQVAKGEYILFIDSDDYIRDDMLEILMDLLKKSNADIVQCEYEKIYNDKIENIKIEKKIIENVDNRKMLSWLYNNSRKVSTIVAWSKIYKRSLFSDIRYPEGKINEDEFTTYKLIYKAKKIVYTNEKLYYYRQRNSSIMNSKYSKKKLDILEALDERLDFFRDKENFKDIYIMTINQYCNFLMRNYYLYKNFNKNDKNTLNDIKKKAKSLYLEAIKYSKLDIKIKLTVFLINPYLVGVVWNLKRKN